MIRNVWMVLVIGALSIPAAQAKIKERHVITVDADQVVGPMYNLWDVRVINVPELWLKPGFAERMAATSKHAKRLVSVRAMGGKHNGECEWFQGVDEHGEPICDFTGLIEICRAKLRVGFTPWLILDNIPWGMAPSQEEKTFYGQCYPAEDMTLWYKYVRDCVQALVDEFGLDEVSTWRFRVATEPDNFPRHWAGTKEEYFEHYDHTVAALESVIAEPRVGPGNIMMHGTSQRTKKKGRWGFDILRHCAEGTNYVTGEVGTRIEFFAHSAYAKVPNPYMMAAGMKRSRAELAKYPALKNVHLEIHEYGEVKECLSKGDALSNTEFFVGLYAYTVDTAYDLGIRRVYNWDHHLGMVYTWDQITVGLFQPWTRVMDCLEEMVDGDRVRVFKDAEKDLRFGAIPAWKDGGLYVLAYSHHPDPAQEFSNEIELTLVGDRIADTVSWSVDEQLLDADNGVYIHQLYQDIEAAGIKPTATNFYIQRNLERRYGKVKPMDKKVFSHGVKEGLTEGEEARKAASAIAKKNLPKYQQMSEMKKVRSGDVVEQRNGKLHMKLPFNGSSIRFLKLTPKP